MASEAAPPPPPSGAERLVRLGLAAAGVFLALLALWRYSALAGERRALTAWLEQGGPAIDARLSRELAREPDIDGLTVRAVRASLAREMAAAGAPGAAAARLEETARRAAAVLAVRPASWEAAMVLGAATYLGESQARDSRLFLEHETWEAPLHAALRLAPAKREPTRFLTASYLEIWPALTPEKRAEARRLVAAMMRDPDDFDALLGPWLAAAGSRREAFSVLPPDARAWERVQRVYADRHDWEAFSEARAQWDRALHGQLRTRLAEADARLAEGRAWEARSLYLSVLEQARPDPAYLDVLDAALTRCPPGPVGRDAAELLDRQLEWALDRCLLGTCDLPPPALRRLAHLAGGTAPWQEAMALLLAGDLPGAQALDRNAEARWSETWSPYLIAKAQALVARRQLAEAAATLDFVPRSQWEQPGYQQARLELARAQDDAAGAARAEQKLREATREAWPATAWSWRRESARLQMLTASPARGLEVELAEVPETGAVVELRLDGVLRGTLPARPAAALRLDVPLQPGPHVLDFASAGGGRVTPGAVRLR
jgi:hypothetical protein